MPSRISDSHLGVFTTGGHKILPYDVVMTDSSVKAVVSATIKGDSVSGQRSQGVPGFRGADTLDHLPDRFDHELRLILVNIVTTVGCHE